LASACKDSGKLGKTLVWIAIFGLKVTFSLSSDVQYKSDQELKVAKVVNAQQFMGRILMLQSVSYFRKHLSVPTKHK
jgi:hypothetical protein